MGLDYKKYIYIYVAQTYLQYEILLSLKCVQKLCAKCILSDIDTFTFVIGLYFFELNSIAHFSFFFLIDNLVTTIDVRLVINY